MSMNYAISDTFNKSTATNYVEELPEQTHHFATNKHKDFTPAFEEIVQKYGLDLDGDWNKEVMKHLGRHPHEYHRFVLETMQTIDGIAAGNVDVFLNLYDLYVKQTVINNPILLRKAGWIY